MIDTLLRLRVFVAVYEERSFTAAASRENLTQSGATQHIQKLEEFLGVALFVRRSGNIARTTPAADAYYEKCVKALRAHAETRQSVKAFSQGLSGAVHVGLTPTLTRTVLAPALAAFVSEHPNVNVCVLDAYGDLVMDRVSAGDLDFAIVPSSEAGPGLESRRFATMPEVLLSAAGAGHAQVNGQPVRLSELGAIKLVVPSRMQARRARIDAFLAESGAVVERMLEIDSSLGATDFIQHSDFRGLYPSVVTKHEIERGGFLVNPLERPALSMDLYQVQRRSDTPSLEAEAFVAELKRQTEAAIAAIDAALVELQRTGPAATAHH